ncbi:MAG: DNA primase [Peptostreptococcaceae bacterium]|nr:DNA primase [Peptostreptococcaceae bacterium]
MSIAINDNIVDEIKSRCNIVDVIGQVVPLKKTGSNHKGVCPFHNEKTPSFVVSETKQIYTCFGCGATGDAIEFVEKYYNLEFKEAIGKMAAQYGIEIKSASPSDGKREELYEINREAATFFYKAFIKSNNIGYNYMKKRGIDIATLKKFGVGYADSEWDSLYNYFKAKGTDVKLLIELGLVSESKGKYFDKYRNRIMFPIINTRGKIIGFGGRAIGDDQPKYLNSPESKVFMKKNNLYGINLTRQDIDKEDYAILVEGYMDAISLYESGIRNVCASLGTALTENQAKLLKRYTNNIVLSYDADVAGQAASLRGMDILYKENCKVKVLQVSDGKDPDEFVRKKGKEAFIRLVKEALPYVDYKIYLLKNKYDMNTTEGSIDLLKESAKILKGLTPIEAEAYIKKLAKDTKISESAIRFEVNGLNDEPVHQRQQYEYENENSVKELLPIDMIEKNIIKILLLKSSYINKVKILENPFLSESGKKIFNMIVSITRDIEEVDIRKLQDSLEERERNILNDIMENIHLGGKEEMIFNDCVHNINNRIVIRKERDLIFRLSMADEEENIEKINEITKELMELQKLKNVDRR